jgi:transposase
MTASTESYEKLIRSAAQHLKGHQRRLFQAEVATELCGGNARQAERRFGWGRETVNKGLHEQQGIRCVENFAARGRPRWEEEDPQRAQHIRAIVEPCTHADPELKSQRHYTNLTAAEVLEALKTKKGYKDEELPSERSMRDILNRMGYRLKRIQKAKPLKKTAQTDAIFANVHAVQEEIKNDPTTLGISVDTKAKVNEGDYSRGGKKPDRFGGANPQGVGP